MVYENWKILDKKIQPNRKKDKPDMGRREFLKKAAIGTAAAAATAAGIYKTLEVLSQNEGEKEKISGDEKIETKESKFKKPKNIPELEELQKNTLEKKENNSKEKEFHAEKIAQEILRVYNSPAISYRFDKEIFSKDFFMAQQFQESRGEKEAKSSSGAIGVYQNKPSSVIDAVNYLSFLRKKTRNLSGDKRCDYSGPEKISLEEAEKVSALFSKESDYGRAAGKLYLLSIYDKDSTFNNYPNPDVFRSKPWQKQQELLLLAYHDGPSRRLNPENASREAKNYVQRVKSHMETIGKLRNLFEKEGLPKNSDYAILKILQELDRKENQGKKEEIVSHWVRKLKEVYNLKQIEGRNSGNSLSESEIREIFA